MGFILNFQEVKSFFSERDEKIQHATKEPFFSLFLKQKKNSKISGEFVKKNCERC